MSKRLLTLLCTFAILFSFAACSSLKEKEDDPTTKKKDTTTKPTGQEENPEDPGSSGGAPYADAVKTYEKYLNGNGAVLEDMAPPELWRAFEEEEGESLEEYIAYYEEEYEESLSEFYAGTYGDDYKFTLTVIDEEECDEDTVRQLENILEERYDISLKNVESAYFLTGTVKISGSKKRFSDTGDLATIQINGKWYLLYCDEYDGELYADFIVFD